jgi:hypothetical protein
LSDFDEVLERLVTDPAFQAAVQADPGRALAGYHLEPDERALLATQLDAGAGEERTVEMRVTKSGVLGLVGPVVSAMGFLNGPSSSTPTATGTFGVVPRDEGTFDPGPYDSDPGPATETFGEAPSATQAFGVVDDAQPRVAAGYATSVDADGDGTWDASTAYERSDGGVDIHVDADGDGRVDFIGRDYNRDGLVDEADLDTDGDGVMDTRMYDDNGDGWLDRSERIPPPGDVQTFGQAPA